MGRLNSIQNSKSVLITCASFLYRESLIPTAAISLDAQPSRSFSSGGEKHSGVETHYLHETWRHITNNVRA